MIDQLIPKSKKILILITALVSMALIIVIAAKPFEPKKEPVKPVVTFNVTPLQKTIINQTPEEELKRLPNYKSSDKKDGVTMHIFSTQVPFHDDQIITKDGVVVYESRLTPSSVKLPGYTKLSEIEASFGQPDQVYSGSNEFGPHIKTYLYLRSSFSVVANPFADEVLRINVFRPINSSDEYLKLYGGDIATGSFAPETQ